MQEIPCPKCGKPMRVGLAFAQRGIFWREPGQKRRWLIFAYKFLRNTFTWGSNDGNLAWHCDGCQVLLIDHSRKMRRGEKMPAEWRYY